MSVITVDLKSRSYPVIIGCGSLRGCGRVVQRLNIGSDAYIVTNPADYRLYGSVVGESLSRAGFTVRIKKVRDSEESKSLECVSGVLSDLASHDAMKSTFIVALGGGVIGDLAGFCAAVYKRGIPYIQIPTTLLAQVDSSIGGKTAVDLKSGKNLVGAYHQPRAVITDVSLLKSLDRRQLANGLAEVIKYGLIRDKELFEYIERNLSHILSCESRAMKYIVERCSAIKAGIVSKDEKETRSLRTILNFGHTIGHAIEAASCYVEFGHGEAVALGMIAACDISRQLGLLDAASVGRIKDLIKRAGLPSTISGVSFKQIVSLHRRDKKFRGRKNRFVLLSGIGKARIVDDISLVIIQKCLKEIGK